MQPTGAIHYVPCTWAITYSTSDAQWLERISTTTTATMKVKRIVANIGTQNIAAAKRFYQDVLGLHLLMDLGWIVTYGLKDQMTIQTSIASQGGSGTPVPDLSIEVDDLDAALERVRNGGFPIEYGPVVEPWGVRRFYTRDPFGKLINILTHLSPSPARP